MKPGKLFLFFILITTLITIQCIAAKGRAVSAPSNGTDTTGTTAPVSNGLAWPNVVSITTDALYRYIRSNGIPDHTTGTFPNARNPNTIAPQNYSFRLSLHPALRTTATPVGRAAVAVNGLLFDPGTAEYWRNNPSSGWRYEALTGGIDLGVDRNNAHVQPTGAYHYHGMPEGLLTNLNAGTNVTQIGWMADGFPLFGRYGYSDPYDRNSATKKLGGSFRVKQGTRSGGPGGSYDGTFEQDWEYVAGLGDLDQCNGRIGVRPDGTVGYQYYVTDTYPFVPRCVMGTPDTSVSGRAF
jgi:hypothetical protein